VILSAPPRDESVANDTRALSRLFSLIGPAHVSLICSATGRSSRRLEALGTPSKPPIPKVACGKDWLNASNTPKNDFLAPAWRRVLLGASPPQALVCDEHRQKRRRNVALP